MAYLWDKILRVTLKPGEYEISQVRTWEERSTNSRCCSAQRISGVHTNAVSVHTNKIWILGNRELRMVQTILETCLSETLASGNRKVWIKDLSHQEMLIPDAKATMEKEWKKVIKKALKKDKESPFCRIDGHPLIQKFVYTLWESSKEHYYFFTWEIILGSMNLYVSKDLLLLMILAQKTVIEKLMSCGRSIISLPKSSWERSTKKEYILRLWPIRLQEKFKNYHPVQVPSLNISERLIWILTIRGWWRTVQKLRKKEENFDNLCFESSKPTVEYHEYGSQDSNNFETKVKPSSMYRETVASTQREIPGLLESGSGNSSSNPSSKHPRTKSIYTKKDIHQEEGIWDCNFWMTDVQKTLRWYSHLQVRMVRHHGESNRNGVAHTLLTRRFLVGVTRIGRSHTSSTEKKIGKEFMFEDWLHCLHRRIQNKSWNL